MDVQDPVVLHLVSKIIITITIIHHYYHYLAPPPPPPPPPPSPPPPPPTPTYVANPVGLTCATRRKLRDANGKITLLCETCSPGFYLTGGGCFSCGKLYF